MAGPAPGSHGGDKLYEGLLKHLAMALMLLRTEVLDLNAWLAKVRVPCVSRHYPCGWHEQTVQHVFFGCPRYEAARLSVVRETPASVQAAPRRPAGRWFVTIGLQTRSTNPKAPLPRFDILLSSEKCPWLPRSIDNAAPSTSPWASTNHDFAEGLFKAVGRV